MKINTISNKVRFEVFKRDCFKCTYCCANSKEIPLEVVHIVPYCISQDNSLSNLTTACKRCNSGKGGNPLKNDNVVIRKNKTIIESCLGYKISSSIENIDEIFELLNFEKDKTISDIKTLQNKLETTTSVLAKLSKDC